MKILVWHPPSNQNLALHCGSRAPLFVVSIKKAFARFLLERMFPAKEEVAVELFDDGRYRVLDAIPSDAQGFVISVPAGCDERESWEIFDLHWIANLSAQAIIAEGGDE